MKNGIAYVKKHPAYVGIIHLIGGIGIGIIASPIAGTHTVGWGIALMIVSLLGHVYLWFM